jgi:hypothetical protein
MTHQIIIYILYFLLFAILAFFHIHFEDNAISIDLSPLDTYATLFLSVLLIDITYRIGKRQNDIAKRQNEIAEQQYKIAKFDNYRDLHRDIYKSKCILDSILPKIYEYFVAADRDVQKNSIDDYFGQLTELLFSIQNGVSDVMLRGDKQLDVQAVLDLVGNVGHILIAATQKAPVGMNSWDWVTTLIKGADFREKLSMDEQVECLFSLSKDPNLKAGMELFVKQYKEVFEGENNILAQLQRLYNE